VITKDTPFSAATNAPLDKDQDPFSGENKNQNNDIR